MGQILLQLGKVVVYGADAFSFARIPLGVRGHFRVLTTTTTRGSRRTMRLRLVKAYAVHVLVVF